MAAGRGRGVGKQLLHQLVQRGSDSDMYLTTLGSTTGFYEPEGFAEVQAAEIPRCIRRLDPAILHKQGVDWMPNLWTTTCTVIPLR